MSREIEIKERIDGNYLDVSGESDKEASLIYMDENTPLQSKAPRSSSSAWLWSLVPFIWHENRKGEKKQHYKATFLWTYVGLTLTAALLLFLKFANGKHNKLDKLLESWGDSKHITIPIVALFNIASMAGVVMGVFCFFLQQLCCSKSPGSTTQVYSSSVQLGQEADSNFSDAREEAIFIEGDDSDDKKQTSCQPCGATWSKFYHRNNLPYTVAFFSLVIVIGLGAPSVFVYKGTRVDFTDSKAAHFFVMPIFALAGAALFTLGHGVVSLFWRRCCSGDVKDDKDDVTEEYFNTATV